jgi:transposase InsO family protein
MFVGIDRTSKFAVTQLGEKANRRTSWEFLQHLFEAVPYQVHTILTDNGIQFAEQPRNRNAAYSRPMRFDMICEANRIEHRLTKPNHPWTNGQVERMNRTIKDDRQALPPRQPRSAAHTPHRLHGRLQLRAQAQDARRSHAL